ncbi:hypothetical protein [Corynebacterium freiburgense]|uniref:hypothetical protein n=1 Tax=Corynebacterium freiburgense TaxID=556548 RepID=UPI00041772A6|nr:hypothetical protein [Corynebacterium freiburgense]WJZ01875.1 ABC-2 family transporter protein [Corynebacterium freiburgense]
MNATASLLQYVRVEGIRLQSSPVLYFSLIGLIFGALSLVLSVGAQNAGFQSAAFSWQVMYFTGMAAPLMMVLAGLSEQRELAARNGGITWRGASAYKDRLARLLGITFVSALVQLLSFGSVILFGAPFTNGVIAATYAWIGSLGLLGIGAIVARRLGTIAALITGIVWQLVGTAFAESTWWWLIPPTWPIRILLVPIGVQVNGVPMEAGHPALDEPAWFGVVLCIVFGVATFAVATRVGERQPSRKPKVVQGPKVEVTKPFEMNSVAAITPTGQRSARTFPLEAFMLALKGSGVGICMVLSAVVIIIAAGTYTIEIVSGFFSFIIVPLGAGILPVLVWRVLQDTYTLMHIENPKITPGIAIMQTLVLGVLVAIVSVCLLGGGYPVIALAGKILLWMLVGTTLLCLALALTVRFGPGASIAAMVFWTIIAITLGGDVLAETFLWIIAFPVWPELASTLARFLIALPLAVLTTLGSWYLLMRTLRAHRRTS